MVVSGKLPRYHTNVRESICYGAIRAIGILFTRFPEVFSNSPQKFHRSIMWLVTDRGVVSPSLRDNFTAGGHMDIVLGNRTYKDPVRIFHNLHDYREWVIKSLEEASADELKEDWDYH